MFCFNCGKPMIDGAAFCSDCGSRVSENPSTIPNLCSLPSPPPYQAQQAFASVVPAPAPLQPGGEDVQYLVKAAKKLSMTQSVVCHVIFKRNWLVMAHLTERLQKQENAQIDAALRAQHLGVMKRTSGMWRYWADFHKRYYTMATDAIIAEDPMNTAINYGMITSVTWSGGYSTSDEDNSYDHDGILHLTLTTGEVVKLTHQERHSKALQETLTGIFGPKLKYKKN